jgi:hypothetical protein
MAGKWGQRWDRFEKQRLAELWRGRLSLAALAAELLRSEGGVIKQARKQRLGVRAVGRPPRPVSLLRELEGRRDMHLARAEKRRAASQKMNGFARSQAQQAIHRSRLRAKKYSERISKMVANLTPPINGQRLCVSGSEFRLGNVVLPRGAFLSDSEAEQAAAARNFSALVAQPAPALAWRLAPRDWAERRGAISTAMKAKRPDDDDDPPPTVIVEMIGRASLPNCEALARAVRELMLLEGKSWAAVQDFAPYDLRMRAQQEYAEAPKTITVGDQSQQTGKGAGGGVNRSILGFWPFIAGLVETQKQEAA